MRCCRPYTKVTSQNTGHIGTLSIDVSEENSKGYGEHSAICVTPIVTGKRSAEGIVGDAIAEGLNMK